ncbi:MAG: hypothetical protein ACKVOR_03725 [Flavobacteriales bacterium]
MNHYHLDIGYLKFKVGYSSLIAFCLSLSSFSQEDTAIVRTYGGPYFEEGRQIIESMNGGYAVIGTTGSDQTNNTNFYLLRLDEALNCLWSKSLGGSEVEWGYSLVEDAGGNFLLCGYTNSYGAGAYDVLVYKVDAEGEVIWQQTYGGMDWDFGYKIIAHPDGGYLICGKTYSMGNGGSDGYLLHIDTEGNLISEWSYGGEGDDEFVDVGVGVAAIYLCGKWRTNGVDFGWFVTLSQDYVLDFNRILYEIPNSVVNDFVILPQSILLVGSYSNEENENNGYHLEIDLSLTIETLTIHPIGTSTNAVANSPTNFFTVGNSNLFGLGGLAGVIYRYDSFFNWQNGAAFGETLDEVLECIIVGMNEQVVVLGSSNSYSPQQNSDVYLVYFQNPEIVGEYFLDVDHENCITTYINNPISRPQIIINSKEQTISANWNGGNLNVQIFNLYGGLIFEVNDYLSGTIQSIPEMAEGIYVIHTIGELGEHSSLKFYWLEVK